MTRTLPILCLLVAATLRAQAPVPTQSIERLTLPSRVMGETRSILVRTPPGYAGSGQRYPVLYMTDGDAHVAHTAATVEFLARNGRIPELIIVGISNTDRTRDLTPTHRDVFTEGNGFRTPTSGGADKFLSFLENEVIPKIEKSYRTQPYRVFAGHSFGGLFALHALYARPELFNAIIAVSPTFIWDDGYLLRRGKTFFESAAPSAKSLFVTLGSEGDAMQRGFDDFKTLLESRKPAGLAWEAMQMSDEDHGSVVLRSHYHGLVNAFDGWRFDLGTGEPELLWDQARDHFARVSARFGYVIPVPEATANVIGYRLMGAGKNAAAIEVFKANVATYPDSANVYDSLGEALEKSGDLAAARENYKRAWTIGKKKNDPNTGIFKTNFDRAARPAAEGRGSTSTR